MNTEDRFRKILAANNAQLAAIDDILTGIFSKTAKTEPDTRLITYTEAAQRLNVSRPTIYRLVALGRLDVVPLGGVNRIRLKSVVSLANSATRKGAF